MDFCQRNGEKKGSLEVFSKDRAMRDRMTLELVELLQWPRGPVSGARPCVNAGGGVEHANVPGASIVGCGIFIDAIDTGSDGRAHVPEGVPLHQRKPRPKVPSANWSPGRGPAVGVRVASRQHSGVTAAHGQGVRQAVSTVTGRITVAANAVTVTKAVVKVIIPSADKGSRLRFLGEHGDACRRDKRSGHQPSGSCEELATTTGDGRGVASLED